MWVILFKVFKVLELYYIWLKYWLQVKHPLSTIFVLHICLLNHWDPCISLDFRLYWSLTVQVLIIHISTLCGCLHLILVPRIKTCSTLCGLCHLLQKCCVLYIANFLLASNLGVLQYILRISGPYVTASCRQRYLYYLPDGS